MKIKSLVLLILLIILFNKDIIAQNNEFSGGYINTQLKKNAMSLAVDIGKDIANTITKDLSLFKTGDNYFVDFRPDIKILVSSEDGFNGILTKYTGSIVFFNTKTVDGIETPAFGKFIPIIPISGGLETDKNFYYVNGLLETGFIPWYQNIRTLNKFIRQTKFGVFIQGGYKFKTTDLPDSLIRQGSSIDESKEKPKESILRLKASFGFEPQFVFNKSTGFGIGLFGNSDVWYDALNSEFYYKVVGKFRLMITKKYNLDFKYEKGSGAPNFNIGEQFGAALTISF